VYYLSAPPIIFRASHISLNLRPRGSLRRTRIGNLLLHHPTPATVSGFVVSPGAKAFSSRPLIGLFNFLSVRRRNFHLYRNVYCGRRAVLSQSQGLAATAAGLVFIFRLPLSRIRFKGSDNFLFFSPLHMDSRRCICCFYGLKGTTRGCFFSLDSRTK
jgi:hypothetical protein